LSTTLPTPLGPLTAVADGDAIVGLYFEGHRPAPKRVGSGRGEAAAFTRLAAALDEYFAGERRSFDDLTVRLDGTPFQLAVWDALRMGVPYGTTATYRELADRLGRPAGARAVGAANARNPVSIVVPCHRLVTTSGALAGYAGGEWRKRFLLDLEATL
jgi:methylated-DNA-[protein]-cysteine S-methyltransferase